MNARQQLLACADRYAEALDLEQKTASWRIFGDQKKLAALQAGGDLYTGRLEAAMQWLSDNWPDGAEWPAGVARPSVSVSPGEPPSAPDGASPPQGGRGAPVPDARPQTPEAAE